MKIKDYIKMELDVIEKNIKRVLDSLNQDEVAWQPAHGCNSIGLILFHLTRSEDSLIHTCFIEKPEIWVSGAWYSKLNMNIDEKGSQYTVEQVNNFQTPQLEDIMAYYAAVRGQTVEYLNAMNETEFDRKFTMPHWGEIPIAQLYLIIVMHTSEHVGEISYLRGLQRGMDK